MRIARPVLISATGFIALLAIFSFNADAGESQWLPEQIASLDFEKFAEGFTETLEKISELNATGNYKTETFTDTESVEEVSFDDL